MAVLGQQAVEVQPLRDFDHALDILLRKWAPSWRARGEPRD